MLISVRDFGFVGILFIAMVAIACPSHAVLIDDFSDGAVSLRREVGEQQITDTQTGLNTDAVIGGAREIMLRARDFIRDSTGAATVDIDTDLQQMIYDTDPGVSAVDFFVQHGSTDEPLHADFAAGGADRIRFEFESASLDASEGKGFLNVILTAQSDDTGVGYSGGSTVVEISSSDDPFVLDLFFDQFSNIEDMNLTDVWSFGFGTGEGFLPGSFVLSRVSTIPEPASVALLGMGVIALRLVVRSKR